MAALDREFVGAVTKGHERAAEGLRMPRPRSRCGAGAHPYREDELQAIAIQGVTTFLSRYGPDDMEGLPGGSGPPRP